MFPSKPISLLVADDHLMMLELWSIVFSRDSRFNLSGKASSGTIVVEMARSQRPDIILMDIHMGPIDGFEATRLIRNYSPKSKIIGISASALTSFAKKMKSLGAMGFVTKSSPFEEVITAIYAALSGHFYYCKLIEKTMQVEQKMYGKEVDESSFLTSRELEIIGLLKNGFSSKQIAKSLQISFNTVQAHRNNIFKKLHVNNIASLIQASQLKGI
jgi:DNA-binding NarL/FixJ family response regulator